MLFLKTPDIFQSLEKLPLQLDSNVFMFEDKGTDYRLLEVYRIGEGIPITVNSVGFWNVSRGMRIISPIWERRNDLQGLPVTISGENVNDLKG